MECPERPQHRLRRISESAGSELIPLGPGLGFLARGIGRCPLPRIVAYRGNFQIQIACEPFGCSSIRRMAATAPPAGWTPIDFSLPVHAGAPTVDYLLLASNYGSRYPAAHPTALIRGGSLEPDNPFD